MLFSDFLIFLGNCIPYVISFYFFGLFSFCPFFAILLKNQVKKFYNYYNYFYRIVLIWLQTVFVGTVFMVTPYELCENINILTCFIFYIWLIEQSNILIISLCNKKITNRRIIYCLCGLALIYQNILVPGFLPIFFFMINYLFDLVRNIIYLFHSRLARKLSYQFNWIIKPFFFVVGTITVAIPNTFRVEFLIPTTIAFTSFYDALNHFPKKNYF